MKKSAIISRDGLYRYALKRVWDPRHTALLVIGLNPSTADATQDDPTIRRCIGFARDWGFGALWMANAFAYRATKIKDMLKAEDPIGPDNDRHILQLARNPKCSMILAAWTKHARHMEREADVLWLLKDYQIHCLGRNNDGSPKHPLYLPAATPAQIYAD